MNNSLKPYLRFKEFDDSWSEIQLGDIGSFKNGLNKGAEDFGFGFPFINLLDVFGKIEIDNPELELVNASQRDITTYTVKKGDVFFIRSSVKRSGVGETVVARRDLENTVYSGFLIRYRTTKKLNNDFKKYCFWTEEFRMLLVRFSTSSANTNINQESLSQLKLFIPKVDEQQKIADFLTAVDSKISQLTEKHRLLKQYKTGVMQQLFSQQIRFKGDDGKTFPDWEEKHFGNVFGRIVSKNKDNNQNVLTISAQKGLISQLEYFNKSVSAKDVSGYYLLNKGDFAYNKSYSQGYPMGAIKLLKRYEKGVVSTLYICFRPKKGYCESFFEQYFDAGLLNREIAKIAQEGARNHGLLNVSVKEFFDDIKMYVPHLKEQQKIAQFLQSIDKKIDAVALQIEQTKLFKKGLLQQMFV
jgi:type I restriction enzyme S subunit